MTSGIKSKNGFGKVSIVGPGLIGGSVGLALKKGRLATHVTGIGHRTASLKKALEMGAVDKATEDIIEGVKDADIVILGISVRLIPEMAKQVMPAMKSSAILTDVGSTKAKIVTHIKKIKRNDVEFVGAHPLAGSEKRGIEAARADLFEDSTCIITPAGARATAKVKALWESLGARVVFLSPEEHDRLMAFISHLPHLVASSLANTVKERDWPFAARGLRDATRIASGDPQLWADIFSENRTELLRVIKDFKAEVSIFEKALREKDYQRLLARLKKAKELRDSANR